MRFPRCAQTRVFPLGRAVWFLATAGLLLPLAGISLGQLPQSRLYAIFPMGGQQGTTVDLTLANGIDLEITTQLLFSHPGITAAPVLNDAKEAVPSQFKVTIAADVPPGLYDVRTLGKYGVSNPRSFVVGTRVEAQETEPNNDIKTANAIEINTTVNARIQAATEIDWYKFTAKQGQRLLIETLAARIDSRLDGACELYNSAGRMLIHSRNTYRSDPLIDFTFPADGEYFIKAYDFTYAGTNDHFYRLTIHAAPHIDFVVPASGLPNSTGEYTLYGRNLPGGTPAPVKLGQIPLEQLKVSIALPADPAHQELAENIPAQQASSDGIRYTLTGPGGMSNPVMIYFAGAPVALEQEPNDAPAQSQKLAVPAELTGQFQARGDIDHFQFEAKAQEVYWIEVFGQRNGNLADPYLTVDRVLVDDKGVETVQRLAALDDIATILNPQNQFAFDTRSDDAEFRFVAPADGAYRLSVRDRYFETRGSPALTYRLAVRKEQPDFRLFAVPVAPAAQPNLAATWDISLRRGDTTQIDLLALRKDGYNGVIDVKVEGLPEGVTCPPVSIGPGLSSCVLVFSSTDQAAVWSGPIRVIGQGSIQDTAAVAAVTAAEAALKAARDAQPALDKAAADTAAASKAAEEKAAAAKKASDDKADDKALEKIKVDTAAAALAAATVAQTAATAKAAGDTKIAEANTALQAAQAAEKAAAKDVAREVRSGTIVWQNLNNAPNISRVARSILLSVTSELAPYQLVTELHKIEVNQSSQILLPVKLLKRDGFDNPVPLTFVGQPQNVQIEAKPINKGADSEIFRLFVQNNAAPGTYTLYLKSQAQVTYQRNVEVIAKALQEKEAADKAMVETAEVAKKAAEAKVVTDKKAVDTAEAQKVADLAKAAADKAALDTAAAEKAAVDAAAVAKKAADDNAGNADLAKAAEVAAAAAVTAAETAKKAAEAKVAADKVAVDAAAAAKLAAEEKVKADKEATDTDTKAKAAVAAQAAAVKKHTDLTNANKPAPVNVFNPTPPLVITIKPGPATLVATPANGGAVKRGEKLEVKVAINRVNGFAGPLQLGIVLPPNVAGLTAEAVPVAADAKEATLIIQAAGDATEGQLANIVVRATMEFNGAASVDQPLAVNVTK